MNRVHFWNHPDLPRSPAGKITVALVLLFALFLALDLVAATLVVALAIIVMDVIAYDPHDPRRSVTIITMVVMALYIVLVVVDWLAGS